MAIENSLKCGKCKGIDLYCKDYVRITEDDRRCGFYLAKLPKIEREYGTQRDIKYFGGEDE